MVSKNEPLHSQSQKQDLLSKLFLFLFRFYLNFVTEEVINPNRYITFDDNWLENWLRFSKVISLFALSCQNHPAGHNLLHGDSDCLLCAC